ncbi:MAG: HAD family hydrolase [Ruminococcaceae bacterium]|nr:HAD family hydrolase [Oscillospiraceae bacterium]
MYKAVIFDLDGTLLDTLEDLADSVNEMLRKFSCPERTIEEIRSFVGNGMKKLVERSVSEDFDKKQLVSAYEFFRLSYSRNMRNKTHPYDGIITCLEELKARGIKTVVTSNKNDDAVKNLCREYFGDLLTLSVGAKEGVPSKPNPEMVISAMREIGAEKEECIFVGDSDTDILTAKNAGLKSVGVLWGFRNREILEKAEADFVISHPCEIISIVKS